LLTESNAFKKIQTMDNMKHRRLQELDRSDFGIVEGEPDIRGWDVRTGSGQKIGEVEELIIDAQQGKVRYMVVELDNEDLDLEDDKKVLIPIGLAELDKEEDDVILQSVGGAQLKALPAYEAERLDDEEERRICAALDSNEEAADTISTEEEKTTKKRKALIIPNNTRTANAEPPSIGTPEYYASFYQHPYFNDENLSRNRSQQNRPQQEENKSEYEHGLRLWEMRNESGIRSTTTPTNTAHDQEMSNDRRREVIRDRRTAYEERRNPKKGKSIIDRINDEGLQEKPV
jgi:sporulation protein YlmC with PRC-barrel domain